MPAYLPRLLSVTLGRALTMFPAVLVTGPRQSGKTTLLQEAFGDESNYVTFDDPLERELATRDPEGFLDRLEGRRAILDEIQYVPSLFHHLKIRIDRNRDLYGRWILTGSQQFGLMASVTESLAGRLAILELLPLSLLETGGNVPLSDEIWLGGYPEPRLMPEKRDLWMSAYIQTYVERDVRQLHHFQDLRAFEAFVALCAARHGQELNMAALSREAGISQPTVRSWLGALEAGYVVRLVPPYFENFGKRVVRSPRLYFLDPAIACTLTRQPDGNAALAGPMGGSLLEGWVAAETLKLFAAEGRRPEIYSWRSHDGLEVDLLLRVAGRLVAVETKLTSTPTLRHLEPIERFLRLAGEKADAAGCSSATSPSRAGSPASIRPFHGGSSPPGCTNVCGRSPAHETGRQVKRRGTAGILPAVFPVGYRGQDARGPLLHRADVRRSFAPHPPPARDDSICRALAQACH